MKKKVFVLSLGGSLIIPDKINVKYLQDFRKVIRKHSKKYKFVIVCGGGSIARKYISGLEKDGKNNFFQSMAGIAATRTNARFMSYFFGLDPHLGIPHTMKTLKRYLRTRDIVFCGALDYRPKQTSDATAAGITEEFKSAFINLTNVPGLHDKNPLTNKNAKFIPKISWKDFEKMVNKISFKPGQHFVLDQASAKIIREYKIPTFILGKNMKNLDNLLKGKKFKGSVIGG